LRSIREDFLREKKPGGDRVEGQKKRKDGLLWVQIGENKKQGV